MEKFELYKPPSLLEISDEEINNLSPEDQKELIELIVIESKETVNALSLEVNKMNKEIFSLDSFYEIQSIIEEYKILIKDLDISDEGFEAQLKSLFEKIEEKNPISEVAKKNKGNVLVHSSDLKSLHNLLKTKNHISEVCATAGSLRKNGDIFRSKKKKIDAGFIFDPKQASVWFSKDVGSHTTQGKRVLEPRFEKFKCSSLEEALSNQKGERLEAWVDTQIAEPIALLLINPDKRSEVIEYAQQNDLPVLFNSHLYQ
jgi:hypothetical protein